MTMKTILRHVAALLLCVPLLAMLLDAAQAKGAGRLVFRHWEESSGLPSDQIRGFVKLPDGRMAVRTPAGLLLFDGSGFKEAYIDRNRQYRIGSNKKNIYTTYLDTQGSVWCKSPGYLAVYDPVHSVYDYDVDSLVQARTGLDAGIGDMMVDADGDLWLVTADGRLVYRDDRQGETVTIGRIDGEWDARYGNITDVVGGGDAVTVVTARGILKTWDKTRRQFTAADETFAGTVADPDKKFKLIDDPRGRRWVMHDNRLWVNDGSGWRLVVEISGGPNFFTAIASDSRGNIWLGSSWSGLRVIDGNTLAVSHYPKLCVESGAKLSNDIQDIYIDPTDGVWIGTLWQGLVYWHRNMSPFGVFHTGETMGKRLNESVRGFVEEPDGTVLAATSFMGVVRYNPHDGTVTPYRPDVLPPDDVYLSLYRDRDRSLWVGSYVNGFTRIMPDGKVQRVSVASGDGNNIGRRIYHDSRDRYWVAVNDEGFGRLDPATGAVDMVTSRHSGLAPMRRILGFVPYDDNSMFVYSDQGAVVYYPDGDSIVVPAMDGVTGGAMGLSVNGAISDTRGLLWIATDRGIYVIDKERSQLPATAATHFATDNSALPGNYVSSIVEDKIGQVWVTTPSGIARITTRPLGDGDWRHDLTTYTYGKDLNAGRVSEGASYMVPDGDIYIGAFNGVLRFNPLDLISLKESRNEDILITGLEVSNRSVEAGDTLGGRVLYDTSVLNGSRIELEHDENFVTVKFSSLDYVSGPHKHYRYRLKGYDPDWVELGVGEAPQASYTGLPSGTYELEVLASGIDGVWSTTPATMTLVVKPPLWQSWWAWMLYALAVCGIVGWIVSVFATRKADRIKAVAEQRERLQRERLNEMKFQFFTNMSHEFRTPLTLIMTPLSHMLKNDDIPPEAKKKLASMYKSAENLLGQVNRLLDFRKLEMGGEKLNPSRCRIVQFVSYLISTFEGVTADRHITLSLNSTIAEDTDVYVDTHKLRHVLTNLYSNAIKFTPEGGSITTRLAVEGEGDDRRLIISVADTGCGIPAAKLPHIFDRFYQAHNKAENPSGSGIGLHLVREYVKLHDGNIDVTSEPGHGTVFTITLPMFRSQAATAAAESADGAQQPVTAAEQPADAAQAPGGKRHRILIAEDNAEFREFLHDYLVQDYDVELAVDGRDALEKARATAPDIVVTDLMMPRMDGLELIAALKQEIATSHIPVILLTARATDESRIESYRVGADSYISKPFNFELLQARIAMLLEQAVKRRGQFRRDTVIEPSAVTITSLDEKMVAKALKTMEENMDNSSFSTVQLGEALGLSRSQLYRKFESVTGMSPADFILNMRLKRAAQLLRDSHLNVSEISEMTGFNSIKYFNKHFKEEFNMTPTEYRTANASKGE